MKKFYIAIALVFVMISSANSMTLEEKIGQLFIIRPDQLDTRLKLEEVHSDKIQAEGIKNINSVMVETLKKYPAGGFAFFRKNIDNEKQLKKLIQDLKKLCSVVPFMAIDEEGGRIARIANHKNFNVPKFKSAQAIAESGKTREAAATIGKYIKNLGFNFDFAPVADINTNPENIVIGDRAFGSSPEFVSRNVSEYLDGLHSQGIIGSIKHFPGHGDTKADTHAGYVEISKTWEELLQAELIPFIENLNKTDTLMTAHITLKNITRDNLPASLSRELLTEKLRSELGYDGVIITDAMMMGAVKDNYTSSEAAVLAIEAGCDIILMPYNYTEAFNGILDAVKSGRISESRIDESVKRIMNLKNFLQQEKN